MLRAIGFFFLVVFLFGCDGNKANKDEWQSSESVSGNVEVRSAEESRNADAVQSELTQPSADTSEEASPTSPELESSSGLLNKS